MNIADFLGLLRNVRGPSSKGEYIARCPAHDDKTASLCVREGEKGIVFKCQAHCSKESVLSSMGLTVRDLVSEEWKHKNGTKSKIDEAGFIVHTVEKKSPPPQPEKQFSSYQAAYGYLGRFVCAYVYRDAQGAPLFEVARIDTSKDGEKSKTFRQHRLIGAGWTFPLVKGVPDSLKDMLYRLPEVVKAIADGKPIFVAEGEKDCDHLAALEYAATTNVMGAEKWRKAYNEQLRGADVYILPDNDEPGRAHAQMVADALRGKAHSARILDLVKACPELPAKGDITDFFQILGKQAGMQKLQELMDAPPDLWEETAKLYEQVGGGYCVSNGCICQRTDDGVKRLSTFMAAPRRIITRDDGVNIDKMFVIDGWSRTGRPLPQVQVSSTKFPSMSWVLENWDFAANIMPGNTVKDRLRYAIIEVGEMCAERETVYAHTGWRKISGKYVYLYQGGAIGSDCVSVALESTLRNYTLAGGDEGQSLADAARDSFSVRNCMAEHIAVPLLGVMFLAPMREFLEQAGYAPGFSLFLLGGTGGRKSTAIALMLSHFGSFHSKNLPASFNDTANSIRKKAFLLKDAPIAVDDYHPETSLQDRRKMESTAQSLSRAFGDGADRGRLKADLSLQEAMPPRGLAVMSGEDMPNVGESSTARYYVVSVGKEDVPITDRLTGAQDMARRGTLRKVMRGYIAFLLEQADKLPEVLETKFLQIRAQATKDAKGQHARAPEAISHIMLGYSMMQDYLVSIGAMTEDEANLDSSEAWKTLIENSDKQGREAQEDRPSKMFLASASELLVNQTAAVKDLSVPASENPGKGMVGYRDTSHYYFLPETAYTMVAKLYSDQGMAFPLSKRMLFKQLRDDGLIMPDADGKTTRSKCINGKMMRLLWIPRYLIDGGTQPVIQQQEQMQLEGYAVVEDADVPF